MKKNGKFITFEGGEGSGKSTQSKKLHEYLLSHGIKAIHTREIGGTNVAEQIRDLLVHNQLSPISELMLVMAARSEHILNLIIPALSDNYWVVCDRFIDSTMCYQSNAAISAKDIFQLHNKLLKAPLAPKAIMPDITFFMDLPPKIGLKRSLATNEINKFEEKDMKFHQEIYEKFKELYTLYPKRIKSINCIDRNEEEIAKEIRKKLGI